MKFPSRKILDGAVLDVHVKVCHALVEITQSLQNPFPCPGVPHQPVQHHAKILAILHQEVVGKVGPLRLACRCAPAEGPLSIQPYSP